MGVVVARWGVVPTALGLIGGHGWLVVLVDVVQAESVLRAGPLGCWVGAAIPTHVAFGPASVVPQRGRKMAVWCASHPRDGRRHEGRRWSPRRGNIPPSALGTAVWIFARGSRRRPRGVRASGLVSTPRLVPVIRMLALMALLLLFSEQLPLVLGLFGLRTPLLADDLGYLGVSKSRMLLYHLGLVMLAVENKG